MLSAINISENGRKIRLQKLETGENDWQVLESKGENMIQPYRADPVVMDSLIKIFPPFEQKGSPPMLPPRLTSRITASITHASS